MNTYFLLLLHIFSEVLFTYLPKEYPYFRNNQNFLVWQNKRSYHSWDLHEWFKWTVLKLFHRRSLFFHCSSQRWMLFPVGHYKICWCYLFLMLLCCCNIAECDPYTSHRQFQRTEDGQIKVYKIIKAGSIK